MGHDINYTVPPQKNQEGFANILTKNFVDFC